MGGELLRSGQPVVWVAAEPYVEVDIHGVEHAVMKGDLGSVIDDGPVEIVVSFPAVGSFCPPRSSIAPAE
ncbi:MAG TPA: hypothetical protein VK906_17780 [Egicoccus sp.]|nr:hypothetical protein [Egicoccus sp.]HSK25040.1 hypothetical protein [Egicoccus sp.]